jgi:hypothetical protein
MRLRPVLLDLTLYQGADFDLTLRLCDRASGAPIDLGARRGRMQIRATIDAPEPLAELSSDNGRIGIAGAEGRITLRLPAAVTATLQMPRGGVYDLALTDDQGAVDRLLMGRVTLDPAVTR